MKKVNAYLLITAVLLIVLGVICIFNPKNAFDSIAWLMGVIVLLSGVVTLLFGLRSQQYLPNAGSTTLLAVFQIVVGLMLSCNWLVRESLIVVFSMWVLLEGVSLGVLSYDYKRSGYDKWWLMTILGGLSVIFGFLALRNPVETGAFLGVLLGIGILANGVIRMVAFFGIKSIGAKIQDEVESATAINIDNNQQPNTQPEEVEAK